MEPTTDNRKTFRLTDAAAASLDKIKQNRGSENAALNHALVDLPRQIEQQEQLISRLREELRQANETGRDWKGKAVDNLRELDELKKALALVGKFLRPAE